MILIITNKNNTVNNNIPNMPMTDNYNNKRNNNSNNYMPDDDISKDAITPGNNKNTNT